MADPKQSAPDPFWIRGAGMQQMACGAAQPPITVPSTAPEPMSDMPPSQLTMEPVM